MTDMEKRRFEDSFKDAFNEAEVGPSDTVWTNIELELEKEAGDKIRRKLFFYKMLAAASISFALLATAVGIYVNKKSELALREMASRVIEQSVIQQQTPATVEEALKADQQSPDIANNSISNTEKGLTPRDGSSQQSASAPALNKSISKEDPNAAEITRSSALKYDELEIAKSETRDYDKSNSVSSTYIVTSNNPRQSVDDGNANVDVANGSTVVDNNSGNTLLSGSVLDRSSYGERELPHLYSIKAPSISFEKPEADPVAVMMARLALEESVLANQDKKEKESKSEKIWTSIGFAAGGFNSINHSVATPAVAASSPTFYSAAATTNAADKQAKASGIAYSMGLSFGTKLSKRWILQSGINYLTQSSDYVATNVVADNNYQSLKAESINSLGKIPLLADAASSDQKLAPTAPYSVNNNVKFFSVPVQAGYLVVNRKFGVQLNAGLSSDFFLQNTITPQSGNLDKTTQGSGENSPYRSINFSGLMGTELTYKLGQRYRIALNPGVRYPLNSVYKSDVGVQSTPVTFDVGLRFRYIFQ